MLSVRLRPMSNVGFAFGILSLVGVLSLFFSELCKHHRRKQMRHVGFEEIIPLLLPVHVAALREWTDPRHETELRRQVNPAAFRSVQRRRIRILIEVTKRIVHNTALLQDIGASQFYGGNPLMVQLGEELVEAGIRVRAYALLLLLRLYHRKATLVLGPFAFPQEFATLQKTIISDLLPAYELFKSKAAGFTSLRSTGFVEPLLNNL